MFSIINHHLIFILKKVYAAVCCVFVGNTLTTMELLRLQFEQWSIARGWKKGEEMETIYVSNYRVIFSLYFISNKYLAFVLSLPKSDSINFFNSQRALYFSHSDYP